MKLNDFVKVDNVGTCRIVKIEKLPDGRVCYLLKKGNMLFTADSSQVKSC